MLSGDNGILQKATTAKENTDSAQIKERIQLAYHSALAGGQGSYTKESLEDELEKEFTTDYSVDDSDDTSWVLNAKGQSVTIPAGKKGEEKVIGTSSDWKLNDAKDTIIAYIGDGVDGDTFVIPNYVDDNKIISIGNGSDPIWAEKFSNPNDFMSGKKLKISEGIENINKNAFVSSLGLTGDLILPESILNIGGAAFAACMNMNGNLYIGKNVQQLSTTGGAPFGSDSFNNLEIHMKNIPSGIALTGTTYTGKLIIGNEVETIGDEAFSERGFTDEIIIPSNVKTIGENAFKAIDKSKIINNSSAEGYPWGAE